MCKPGVENMAADVLSCYGYYVQEMGDIAVLITALLTYRLHVLLVCG